MSEKTLYVTPLCAVVFLALLWYGRRSGTQLPFPPGPKRLPFLGNILDVPSNVPIWQTFAAIAKRFSMCPLYPLFPQYHTEAVCLKAPM